MTELGMTVYYNKVFFFRDPLYSLAVIDEHIIATGDENGVVRSE